MGESSFNYWKLVLPDRTDIIFLPIASWLSLVFLKFGMPGVYPGLLGYINMPYFEATLGILYLSAWGWRYGYFGIFHMMASTEYDTIKARKTGSAEPNIRFFDFLFAMFLFGVFVLRHLILG